MRLPVRPVKPKGEPMAREPRPKPDDPEQSARFIETMERIELVENPKQAFEDALKKIGKAKKRDRKTTNR